MYSQYSGTVIKQEKNSKYLTLNKPKIGNIILIQQKPKSNLKS